VSARAHRNAARQKTAIQQESPRDDHPRLRQLPRSLRLQSADVVAEAPEHLGQLPPEIVMHVVGEPRIP